MKSGIESKALLMLAGGALLLAGYWMGSSQPPAAMAQARHPDTPVSSDGSTTPGNPGAGVTSSPAPGAPGSTPPGPGGADIAIDAESPYPFGVSIPNGGAAVVKGRDGYAYLVDTRGVYVRVAQSGKPLALP